MKNARSLGFCLTFLLSLTTAAFADNKSEIIEGASPRTEPAAHPWALELNATLLGNYNENTYSLPKQTWTGRYQPARFLNQSYFNPWIEGEAGVGVVEVYPVGRRVMTLVRPAGRASVGFDLHPLPASDRVFISLRASYLALSDFSNTQFGVGSGVRF